MPPPDAAIIYEYRIDALARDLRVLLAYQEDIERSWALAPAGFALSEIEAETAYFNDYGDPP